MEAAISYAAGVCTYGGEGSSEEFTFEAGTQWSEGILLILNLNWSKTNDVINIHCLSFKNILREYLKYVNPC